MTFVPDFGTGFEAGSIEIIPSADMGGWNPNITVTGEQARTGAYGLRMQAGGGPSDYYAWVRFPFSGTDDIYIGSWCRPHVDGNRYMGVGVTLSDGSAIELRHYTSTWNLYIAGGLVQSGSIAGPTDTWQHVQFHITVGNSGVAQSRIDGVTDIDYSGDTQPGATSQISYARLWVQDVGDFHGVVMYFDDLCFGTGDWPGDIRFQKIVPSSDVTAEWIPSSGPLNYALVDEVPPSDADYVSSGSTTDRDLYEMSSWDGTQKTPKFLTQWIRAKKDSAGTRQLQFIASSGGSESVSSAFDVTTSYAYYNRVIASDPNGGVDWTEAAINALQTGMESS